MKKNEEKGDLKEINWVEVQNFYNQDNIIEDVIKKFGLSKSQLRRASAKKLFKARKNHTDSYKAKASLIRKKFLQNNPDKHPWKKPNKHKSEPCEKVKEFLTSLGIQFIEEFAPEIEGRFFSIDIAMPDKMIALEINGQHHYERDGSLKPYYLERHNLLEAAGWRVFEIHYSACFKFEKWQEFIELIQECPNIQEFDYFNYIPKTKRRLICSLCKKEKKNAYSKFCVDCAGCQSRKTIWPAKQELEELIKTMPMTEIGKKYGVSDNAVRNWCQKLEIELKPKRGYWSKAKAAGLEPA